MFWFSFVGIPASSTIVIYIVLLSIDISVFAKVLAVIIMMGINTLVFYLHDSLSKAHKINLQATLHSKEKEYYFTQCQIMQESVAKVKSIRHDIKIHLAVLKEFTIKYKADDVAEYISSLLGDVEDSEIYSETGNLAFDSIINFKLKDIKNDNIKLDMRIQVPPILGADDVDIVTIMGNLLDNALEAVAKADEKIIRLNIVLNKGAILIKMENTFDGNVSYLDNKKELASSKNEPGHGHGLKNIKRSVDKYNGYVKISHEGNIFSIRILLFLQDE